MFFRQQQNSLHFTFLVSLMDKVGLQKNSCKIIDVTNKRGTVETLTEAKISCAIEEKVCNSWADKEAKHFKIQDTLFITFYYCFEPNASTCTPHCLGTWSTEPQRCTKWNRRRTTKHTVVVKITSFRFILNFLSRTFISTISFPGTQAVLWFSPTPWTVWGDWALCLGSWTLTRGFCTPACNKGKD